MTAEITIDQIQDFEGQSVRLKGWLYLKTGKGKLQFLRLRDGTGIVQCVAYRPDIGDELFEQIKRLGQESSLVVTGRVRADSRAPGIPGGYEVGIEKIQKRNRSNE